MDENVLLEKIMLSIAQEKRAMAMNRRVAVFSLALILSFGGLIPALKGVYSGFVNSGFTQIFSLIFSDTAIVMSLWQNFALSLLETLPINGILAVGVLSIIFFGSVRFLSKQLTDPTPRLLGPRGGVGRII